MLVDSKYPPAIRIASSYIIVSLINQKPRIGYMNFVKPLLTTLKRFYIEAERSSDFTHVILDGDRIGVAVNQICALIGGNEPSYLIMKALSQGCRNIGVNILTMTDL